MPSENQGGKTIFDLDNRLGPRYGLPYRVLYFTFNSLVVGPLTVVNVELLLRSTYVYVAEGLRINSCEEKSLHCVGWVAGSCKTLSGPTNESKFLGVLQWLDPTSGCCHPGLCMFGLHI